MSCLHFIPNLKIHRYCAIFIWLENYKKNINTFTNFYKKAVISNTVLVEVNQIIF